MSKNTLQAELDYVRDALRTLQTETETRDLSDEEWTEVREGLDFIEAGEARMAEYERMEQAAAAGGGHSGDGARDFQHQRKVEDRDVPVSHLSRSEARDQALALVERNADHLSDSQERAVEGLVRRNDGFVARRALITESEAYRSAFMKMAEGHNAFTADESRALDEFRELNITTPGDGGYGVPIMIDPTIIITDQETENPFIRAGANVEILTTKDWRGVSAAGVTWAFETESATSNDISPTLAQPTIYAHKAQGTIPYSIEVGMDYPGFSAQMGRLLEIGYDELLVDKFTRGSGSGEPWGVFEAAEQATSQVVVDTDGQFNVEDVYDVWAALPQKYRRRASWLMNVGVNNAIRQFGDNNLYKQTNDLSSGWASLVQGRPVYESPYAPDFTGTTGAASILVVGDFSNFYIAQRAGMNVEFVPHLFDTATTGLPKGQRALYAWTRVGSDIVVDEAFRMLVNT